MSLGTERFTSIMPSPLLVWPLRPPSETALEVWRTSTAMGVPFVGDQSLTGVHRRGWSALRPLGAVVLQRAHDGGALHRRLRARAHLEVQPEIVLAEKLR